VSPKALFCPRIYVDFCRGCVTLEEFWRVGPLRTEGQTFGIGGLLVSAITLLRLQLCTGSSCLTTTNGLYFTGSPPVRGAGLTELSTSSHVTEGCGSPRREGVV
jgi:hypothetical protein